MDGTVAVRPYAESIRRRHGGALAVLALGSAALVLLLWTRGLDEKRAEVLFPGLLFAWTAVVAVATASVFHRERGRLAC